MELQTETLDRLNGYIDALGSELPDKRQRASFALYALGLLSDGERKSMEPIAARASGDPSSTHAVHERLIHFLAASRWSDEAVRRQATRYALEAMRKHGHVRSWIVDDTGFLKQGRHSPGVQRQYTGSAGKTANCQIGVSLVLGTDHAHVAADFRLYIPESWTSDRERCRRAHIPEEIGYEPKWCLALEMIESALKAGLPRATVLGDCGYGNNSVFRETLSAWSLQYALEIQGTTKLRVLDATGAAGEPISAAEAGRSLARRLRSVTWREGTRTPLSSRFARMRVIVEKDDDIFGAQAEWLLIEWPQGEAGPTKFVLSTLPAKLPLSDLVNTFKMRWRIERSYEDLKGELGLDHYEGRSFVGWHHHVSVVLACYAFLVAEHARSFPPSAKRKSRTSTLKHAS